MTLSSIEFCSDSVSKMDGRGKSVSIARSDIRRISLKYGFTAERPMAQAIVGVILILLGFLLGVRPVFRMFVHHDFPASDMAIRLFAFAVPLILIGGYYLYMLLAKRFYLLVQTDADERRLIFKDNLRFDEVSTLCSELQQFFGICGASGLRGLPVPELAGRNGEGHQNVTLN